MSLLRKKAEDIVRCLQEEFENGHIDNLDDLDTMVFEMVDSDCIYTADNWDVAKEADLTQLDSGLWEGIDDIDQMMGAIAYGAISQEVWNILHDDGTIDDFEEAWEREEEEEGEENV